MRERRSSDRQTFQRAQKVGTRVYFVGNDAEAAAQGHIKLRQGEIWSRDYALLSEIDLPQQPHGARELCEEGLGDSSENANIFE